MSKREVGEYSGMSPEQDLGTSAPRTLRDGISQELIRRQES